jgi:hypothetical protein
MLAGILHTITNSLKGLDIILGILWFLELIHFRFQAPDDTGAFQSLAHLSVATVYWGILQRRIKYKLSI